MKKAAIIRRASRGASALVAAAALAVLALAALILLPHVRAYQERGAATACAIGIASAQRKMDDAAALKGGALSEDEAKRAAVRDLKDWSELCPSGGDCCVIPDGDGRQVLVCPLHCDDKRLRTRLNADHALAALRAALSTNRDDVPDAVSVTVNNRVQQVLRADEPPLRRGTGSTAGFEGTVAFFQADGTGAPVWFCYADENYFALWRKNEGWSGDCF